MFLKLFRLNLSCLTLVINEKRGRPKFPWSFKQGTFGESSTERGLFQHPAYRLNKRRRIRAARNSEPESDGQIVCGCVFKARSEEHTSELQSLRHLVCRLL